MKPCPICKEGILTNVNDIVADLDGYLFVINGERCSACAEEILDEREAQKMITIAKRMNLWGEPLKLHRKLSKSARGTVLRIPTDIEKELGLKGTEEVAISKVGRKLVVEIE